MAARYLEESLRGEPPGYPPRAGKTGKPPNRAVAHHPRRSPAAGTLHAMQALPQPVWSCSMCESCNVLDRLEFVNPTRSPGASGATPACYPSDSILCARMQILQDIRSLRRQATIHIQNLPSNPLRVVTSEIHYSPRMVVGVTKFTARNGYENI
jgi:hypothetical protein